MKVFCQGIGIEIDDDIADEIPALWKRESKNAESKQPVYSYTVIVFQPPHLECSLKSFCAIVQAIRTNEWKVVNEKYSHEAKELGL